MKRSANTLFAALLVTISGSTLIAQDAVPAQPSTPVQPAAEPEKAAAPAAPAITAQELESAKTAIARALAAYKDIKSYSDKGSMKFELNGTAQGMPLNESSTDDVTFAIARPNQFVLNSKMVAVHNDGTTYTVLEKNAQKYSQKPAPADAGLGFAGPFGQAFDAHPVAKLMLGTVSTGTGLPNLESITGFEKKESGGKTGVVVRGTGPAEGLPMEAEAKVEYWFDDETGLIGSMKVDLVDAFKKMTEQMGQGSDAAKFEIAELSMALADAKANPELSADAFAFKAGEKAEKVDDLMQALSGSPDMGPDTTVFVGQPAPMFTSKTLDGGTLSLKDLRGKVVLMDFWATWCGPCVRAMPHIQALHEKYSDKDVVVIGMNSDVAEALDTVKQFVADRKVTFRHVLDSTGDIGTEYRVQGIPCTLLLDREGKVQTVHVGFSPGDEKELAAQIDKLLKGESLFEATVAEANGKKLAALKAEAESKKAASEEEKKSEPANTER